MFEGGGEAVDDWVGCCFSFGHQLSNCQSQAVCASRLSLLYGLHGLLCGYEMAHKTRSPNDHRHRPLPERRTSSRWFPIVWILKLFFFLRRCRLIFPPVVRFASLCVSLSFSVCMCVCFFPFFPGSV